MDEEWRQIPGFNGMYEVNHIDLDKGNNKYTNLEWVTHSQNQKHQRRFHTHDELRKSECAICGKRISRGAVYCTNCWNRVQREKWPSADVISEDIKTLSFLALGRKYGCSDNIVRRMCVAYGLPSKRSDVKQYRESYS